jgi:hypothetical protein
MTRPTVKSLIIEDLGYCCLWFFFKHYRQTGVVADRLGVTPRAIRYAKADVDEGREVCRGCANCLHKKITLAGDLRKN